MARHTISNGVIVDTTDCAKSWDEDSCWDGRKHVSRATGSEWNHQGLYLTKDGRYYVLHWSQWKDADPPFATFVSKQEAAAWLLKNGHGIL